MEEIKKSELSDLDLTQQEVAHNGLMNGELRWRTFDDCKILEKEGE